MSTAIPYSYDAFAGIYDIEDWPSRLGSKMGRVEKVEAIRAARSNIFSNFFTIFQEVESVWMNRRQLGWDGYDALPIKKASAEDAKEFLRHLSQELLQPEIVPENEGTLALEWQQGDSVFVVSFQGSGKLVYAGDFDNGRRLRGYENLAKGIPQTIMAVLDAEFLSD
jgi:hypothetical protein